VILDVHMHLRHGDAARTVVAPETVVAAIDRGGVDQAVVFAISEPAADCHARVDRARRAFPERLIPFATGRITEGEAGRAEVEHAVRDLGFAGVKVHFGEVVAARGAAPGLDDVLPMFERIAELGVPALVDAAGALDVFEVLAGRMRQVRFILAHLGNPRDAKLIDRGLGICAANENVWTDCSYVFVPGKRAEAVARCRPRKVLFGSDGPSDKVDAAEVIAEIRALGLGHDDEAAILGENARALLAPHWPALSG